MAATTAAGTDAPQHCEVHGEKLRQLEKRVDKIDVVLDKVQNRLPHWATFTLAAMLGMIGWLMKGVIH